MEEKNTNAMPYDGAPTESLPSMDGNTKSPTAEFPTVEFSTSEEATDNTTNGTIYEATYATTEVPSQKSKDYWYQRIGRSVGASIGACAAALLVVSLVSGVSAYAGTNMATDDRHRSERMEQSFKMDDDKSQSGRGQSDSDRFFNDSRSNRDKSGTPGLGVPGFGTPGLEGSTGEMPSDGDQIPSLPNEGSEKADSSRDMTPPDQQNASNTTPKGKNSSGSANQA